ncbi:hydantoinase/oxoprolinase family protein [Pseudomaricurvus alkylphenolicus]|uniref:hydantoinase/oxoprolinase family protein n=1 Tax=Pseudomaricurvus alkylphenolicus TaxID=1306991 RepID=UPI00141DC5E4|nr:hydantoinase/oxoprolinase family protein [Pseudomaricurvus alkylphenolicus]NIB42173.1 hydantoinase/oxoprolinase family protein [Pseudomaricurvus alkylphenolicus]
MRVATDVGGTFTDLVCVDANGVRTVKADTTPPNFEQGVLNAIDKSDLDAAQFDYFAHGTTVVINALLSRKGSKTALITTRGFRDVLEIARGNRPDLFNIAFEKPAPFVPRYLRHEVTERLSYDGEVSTPVQLQELDEIVAHLRAEQVEAIAICLLHGYVNPIHEQQIKQRVLELWPQAAVIASHEVCREWREYERTSTTVLSAYVLPITNRYLGRLESHLHEKGLKPSPFIMQSNGGVATVKGTLADPITLVESGPASGMLGAASIGQIIGEENLIALDIGGTTAKCALIHEGKAQITTEYRIEWDRENPGYPIRTPVVDLVEIGNGGGSIAWIDEGNRMHVGPQSAGSSPGPAAYGRGGDNATTTDANLLLGRINPELFLGGEQKPDWNSLYNAFDKLAQQLGGSHEEVARGVIRIANANMVNALKLVSLNRGYDPRDFSLIAFGGGGAMHAVALAEELKVKKVIVPVNASVFSAWGMLMSDLRRDFLQTSVENLKECDPATVDSRYNDIACAAQQQCENEGIQREQMYVERYADMRYLGQEHTIKIPLADGNIDQQALKVACQEFHRAHEREYCFTLDNPIELVNYHVVVFGKIEKQPLVEKATTGASLEDARKAVRKVDFDDQGIHEADIYDLARLEPGMSFVGPAIIEDATNTIVITPHKQVRMDAYGNIHILIEGQD